MQAVKTKSQQGQAVPLMVVVLLLAALTVMAISHLGQAVDSATQARTAADAAALAGAIDGYASARELAERNGAILVDYVAFGNQIEVRVQVKESVAVARAERSVAWGAQ